MILKLLSFLTGVVCFCTGQTHPMHHQTRSNYSSITYTITLGLPVVFSCLILWLRPMYMIPESGKYFACRIRDPELWNPNAAQGIRNPTNDWNPESKFQWKRLESGTWNPQSMEWNLESKDYLGFFSMGRYDWLRARDNHPIIINLLSTKLPNPTFYLSSSRFVKRAEMGLSLYIYLIFYTKQK